MNKSLFLAILKNCLNEGEKLEDIRKSRVLFKVLDETEWNDLVNSLDEEYVAPESIRNNKMITFEANTDFINEIEHFKPKNHSRSSFIRNCIEKELLTLKSQEKKMKKPLKSWQNR